VHIVGGGARNELLNQFAADALNLPVLAGPEEATAVGNILIQAKGLGLIESLPSAQAMVRETFSIQEYRPKENHQGWEGAIQTYRNFREIDD